MGEKHKNENQNVKNEHVECYQLIPAWADLFCVGKVAWIPRAEGWVSKVRCPLV